MCKLSFDEIKDGYQFQSLVAAYFRCLALVPGTNIVFVEVAETGIGPDGGVDIIIHIGVYDGLETIRRTYIVQCKFHERNIDQGEIEKHGSVTGLIVAHNACGYVLICKKMATNPLKQYFVKLSANPKFNFSYQVWSGEELLARLHNAPDTLIKQFFPRYFACSRQ